MGQRAVRETTVPRIPLKYIRFWDSATWTGSARLLMEFLSGVIRAAKNLSIHARSRVDKLETHRLAICPRNVPSYFVHLAICWKSLRPLSQDRPRVSLIIYQGGQREHTLFEICSYSLREMFVTLCTRLSPVTGRHT